MPERERLEKIKRELEALRRSGGIRARELIAVARKIGYREVNRGKEPTWEHERPDFLPLTVPGHSGDLARGTAIGIIDRLLMDLAAIMGELEEGDDEKQDT